MREIPPVRSVCRLWLYLRTALKSRQFAAFSINEQIPLRFSYNCILLAGYRRPHDGHAEQMVVAAPTHSLPRDSSQVLRRQPQVCTVQQRRYHRDRTRFDLLLRLLKRGGGSGGTVPPDDFQKLLTCKFLLTLASLIYHSLSPKLQMSSRVISLFCFNLLLSTSAPSPPSPICILIVHIIGAHEARTCTDN